MPTPEVKRSDATRTALMTAAREEFAELGLAGARVDRIAEGAGVNKERIYGIFGSKDKLFDAVLVDVMQEFAETVVPLWRSHSAGDFVGRLYDYHREHPQLLRLLVWEALHRGDDAHDVDGWRNQHSREKREGVAERFGTDGPFQGALLALALCGIPNWINLVPQLRHLMLGDRANDTEAIKAFLIPLAEGAANAVAGSVNTLTAGASDPVAAAAERLRLAQAETEAAKAALGEALRTANAAGASANHLAKSVAGTISRPVVLKLLAA